VTARRGEISTPRRFDWTTFANSRLAIINREDLLIEITLSDCASRAAAKAD